MNNMRTNVTRVNHSVFTYFEFERIPDKHWVMSAASPLFSVKLAVNQKEIRQTIIYYLIRTSVPGLTASVNPP